MAVKFHARLSLPRTLALPLPVIVKRRSSLPAGACGLAPPAAGAIAPLTATLRSFVPVARMISVEPVGTAMAAALRAVSPCRKLGRITGGRPVYTGGVTQA